jgi:hypothetical protein
LISNAVKVEWRDFEMPNAKNRAITLMSNEDPIVNAFLRQAREYELMQAVGRIRPFTEGEKKTVIVFSPVPIPYFPPTELCTRAQLRQRMNAGGRSSDFDTLSPLALLLDKYGKDAPNGFLAQKLGVCVRTIQRRRKRLGLLGG